MDHTLILVTFIGLQTCTHGLSFGEFIAKHKVAIEAHVMAGYGGGWKECDRLVLSPEEKDTPPGIPQFVMDVTSLKAFDISSGLSRSHCLLVTASVGDLRTLMVLIKFGWTAVHHKRLGMALKLASNITLDMATNITSLPFVIGAQLEGGEEQFLCPYLGMGENMPHLQNSLHQWSSTNYFGKTIIIGFSGHGQPPWAFRAPNGKPDGVDVRLVTLLQKKWNFMPKLVVPLAAHRSRPLIDMVCNTWICEQLIKTVIWFQVYGRKMDLLLRRSSFTHFRYSRVDYLNYLGSWEKYPISRQPREIPNFLTTINPIDSYVWLCLIITVLSISLTLVTFDKFYSWWNDVDYDDTVYKSNIALNLII